MWILIIILGGLAVWLDGFFLASWPADFKISFLILGLMICLKKNQTRYALIFLGSAAVAADLVSPVPWWGARLVGYALLYGLVRFLSDSFWPLSKRGGALILTFLLSLILQFGAGFYYYFYDWWRGLSAPSPLTNAVWLPYLFSSAGTAALFAIVGWARAWLNATARRFFLIR